MACRFSLPICCAPLLSLYHASYGESSGFARDTHRSRPLVSLYASTCAEARVMRRTPSALSSRSTAIVDRAADKRAHTTQSARIHSLNFPVLFIQLSSRLNGAHAVLRADMGQSDCFSSECKNRIFPFGKMRSTYLHKRRRCSSIYPYHALLCFVSLYHASQAKSSLFFRPPHSFHQ